MVDPVVDSLSLAQARRVALAAQGFGKQPSGGAGTRQLAAGIRKLGLLQLDSVNVFERSHYLPLYARLGPYDRADLDRLTFARRSSHTEYWAHQAAIIPVDTRPLWRWRMNRMREREGVQWIAGHTGLRDWLLAELRDNGPMRASDIEHDSNKRSGPWWGWSDVKQLLELMFLYGDVVTAGRTRFERTYALPEQVLSGDALEREVPREEAQRTLVEHATRAHGIATTRDVADYYRMRNDDTLMALRALEDGGVISQVRVDGWKTPAWLHRDARIPRRIEATALLSPFDPVVWERARTERLFDFHYRIEIYTPAPKRIFGYYSLPILIDEQIVGRIDLKSDRQAGVLRVQSAWHEPDAEPGAVADRLAPLLTTTAAWQGLERVELAGAGNLSPALCQVFPLRNP